MVPQLEVDFYLARMEHYEQKDSALPDFTHREAFIKNWKDSKDDILRFGKGEDQLFKNFMKSLRVAFDDYRGWNNEVVTAVINDISKLNSDREIFRSHPEWVKSTYRTLNVRLEDMFSKGTSDEAVEHAEALIGLLPGYMENDNAVMVKYERKGKSDGEGEGGGERESEGEGEGEIEDEELEEYHQYDNGAVE